MEGALFTKGIRAIKVNVNPPSLATVTESDQDVTVPGVQVGDLILGITPSAPTNPGYYARRVAVQAANTVRISWRNESTGTVDPGALDITFLFLPLGGRALRGKPR
jgi:hypothetical protein